MLIETKYKPEDIVWLMWENRPITREITGIHTSSCFDSQQIKTSISYSVKSSNIEYKEGDLYPTKEALLQSL